MNKVWMITGAGRGFGRAFVKEAVKRNDKVIATVRHFDQNDSLFCSESVLPVIMDVTDKEQIKAGVKKGFERFGRIDYLVNNAGVGMHGAFEEFSDEELRGLFDVDFFSVTEMTRAVLPIMREQRSGRILNVSSVSGLVGEACCVHYNSVKFALVGFSEALNDELAEFNIQVCALCPGSFRTDYRDNSSLRLPKQLMKEYEGSKAREVMEWLVKHNHMQAGDPNRAAAFVYDMFTADHVPSVLAMGRDCCDSVIAHHEQQLSEIRSYYDKSVQTAYEE